MTISTILAEIDAEIARLTQVRSLLSGSGAAVSSARRPKKTPAKAATRVLSPEARKRIADAQRKRWAAQRAKKKEA